MNFLDYMNSLMVDSIIEEENPQQLAQIKAIDAQIEAKKKQIEALNKQLAQLVSRKAALGGMVDKEL